jgi:hypothetical protein
MMPLLHIELLPIPSVFLINQKYEIVAANNQMQGKHLDLRHCPFCFGDDETPHLIFQYLLQRVWAGHPVQFTFRPTFVQCNYLMAMTICLEEHGLVALNIRVLTSVGCQSHWEQPAATRDLLRICAWCRVVVAVNEQWIEIEKAVPYLRLFEQPRLPLLSHGMCEACRATLRASRYQRKSI